MSHQCIEANNTAIALKKAFQFISNHQLSPNGYLMETTVYLAINLNVSQFAFMESERVSSANTVSGLIGEITDTNVVILSPTNCPNIYNEYTIEYSKIIEIGSSSIYYYYDEFLLELATLPPICKRIKTQYTEILCSLKNAIRKYKDIPGYNIKVIFNGLTSRKLLFKNVEIVSNLFISEKVYIIPLNYIGGYAVIPPCDKDITLDNGGNYV